MFEARDGQNHTDADMTVRNCFFCMKDKIGCGLFVLNKNDDPVVQKYNWRAFVICPDCAKKPGEEMCRIIAKYLVEEENNEKKIGVGVGKLTSRNIRKMLRRKKK